MRCAVTSATRAAERVSKYRIDVHILNTCVLFFATVRCARNSCNPRPSLRSASVCFVAARGGPQNVAAGVGVRLHAPLYACERHHAQMLRNSDAACHKCVCTAAIGHRPCLRCGSALPPLRLHVSTPMCKAWRCGGQQVRRQATSWSRTSSRRATATTTRHA